jgi:thiol-disulfide isomerase/thioredoxin
MRETMQRWTVMCIMLTLILAGCVEQPPVRPEVEQEELVTIELPDALPKWMGTDHTNTTRSFEAYENASYMAYFSAPWCAHCESTIDTYDSVLPADRIVVFSMESREEYENMSEWHNTTETNLNRTIDRPFIRSPSLAKELGVRSIPHAIFINAQGYVFHVQVGKTTNTTYVQEMWDTTELAMFDPDTGWSHELIL